MPADPDRWRPERAADTVPECLVLLMDRTRYRFFPAIERRQVTR